jgi:hypothetical protein
MYAPLSYSSDVTLFGAGIASLETANDELNESVGNQAEKEELMVAVQGHAPLAMRNCNQFSSLGSDGQQRPCVIALDDITAPSPPEFKINAPCVFSQGAPVLELPSAAVDALAAQAYIIRQYELALSALVSSTDAAPRQRRIISRSEHLSAVLEPLSAARMSMRRVSQRPPPRAPAASPLRSSRPLSHNGNTTNSSLPY